MGVSTRRIDRIDRRECATCQCMMEFHQVIDDTLVCAICDGGRRYASVWQIGPCAHPNQLADAAAGKRTIWFER